MAILQGIVDALTPKATEAEATVETVVTPAPVVNSDIAWETAITGETEAIIYSTDK